MFTTWRLLRGNTVSPDSVIRCLLFFAEVPPLGKLAIPFAFMPVEMIDYEVEWKTTYKCSPNPQTSSQILTVSWYILYACFASYLLHWSRPYMCVCIQLYLIQTSQRNCENNLTLFNLFNAAVTYVLVCDKRNLTLYAR